jgi:tetratricopeptide (TPR) repeat protein
VKNALLVIFAVCIFDAGLLAQSSDSAAHPQNMNACAEGDQAVAGGHWEAARGLYDTCLASGPPRFEILSNLGMVYTRLGLMQEAIDSYQKALALSPGNPKVEFNLAVSLVKAGNYNAAAEHLSGLQRTEPGEVRVTELLAFSYYHMGRYSLAAREAERVYRTHPEDAGNTLILGSAYTRLGLYDKALPLITFALKTAGSAEGHLIMGETLLGLRLYHPAMDELTQAAALQPDLLSLHSALGVGKVGLGDSAGAMAEFKIALDADPNDYQANYYMGRLKRLDEDILSARKFLEKAEQLSPGSPEVLFEYAVIEIEAHDYSKAETLLDKVLRQQPDHSEAHFLLAEVYLKQGHRQQAQREREIFEKLRKDQQDKTSREGGGGASENSTASSPPKQP